MFEISGNTQNYDYMLDIGQNNPAVEDFQRTDQLGVDQGHDHGAEPATAERQIDAPFSFPPQFLDWSSYKHG